MLHRARLPDACHSGVTTLAVHGSSCVAFDTGRRRLGDVAAVAMDEPVVVDKKRNGYGSRSEWCWRLRAVVDLDAIADDPETNGSARFEARRCSVRGSAELRSSKYVPLLPTWSVVCLVQAVVTAVAWSAPYVELLSSDTAFRIGGAVLS